MLQGDVRVSDTLDAREKAWSSGSYATSCSAGLRSACFALPATTRAFVRYLRSVLPDSRFSAISVCSNVQVPWHKDKNLRGH